MPIPRTILDVPRPKSTRVTCKNNIYYVVKRTSHLVDGKPRTKDVGIIGKIVNNTFVCNDKYLNKQPITYLDYGNVKFLTDSTISLLLELKEVYADKEAETIYVLSIIRVLYDSVIAHAQDYYNNSYLSKLYPNLALSENTVSKLIFDLGAHYQLICKYTQTRANKAGHKILIDGMLKDNKSSVNTYSAFSRKAKVKGYEQISLVYAYDLENKEPIGAKLFGGNVLDQTSFISTIDDLGIKRGMVIADKGYFNEENLESLRARNIKYLLPLKDNSDYIKSNILGKQFQVLSNTSDEIIRGYKVNLGKRKYLYAYINESIKNLESNLYLENIKKHKDNHTVENYELEKEKFGLIVFISNYNTELETIYTCYEERWNIECMFRCYKNVLSIDTVNVQEDQSLIGSEFINLIAVTMECKVKKILVKKDLYGKLSVKYLFEILKRLKRYNNNQDWVLTKQIEKDEVIYKKLDII